MNWLGIMLGAMTALAHEGWLPTLELWTEPGTLMDCNTSVEVTVPEREDQNFTTYTCNGFTDQDILK